MVHSEKLDADYQQFIKTIEETSQTIIEKIRLDLGALKKKAVEVGEATESHSESTEDTVIHEKVNS